MAEDATRTESKKGWGKPLASRKFHWFEKGRSLCSNWGFFTDCEPPDGGGYGTKDPVGDCAGCWKVIERRLAKGETQ